MERFGVGNNVEKVAEDPHSKMCKWAKTVYSAMQKMHGQVRARQENSCKQMKKQDVTLICN
jgi:hypothetical protein